MTEHKFLTAQMHNNCKNTHAWFQKLYLHFKNMTCPLYWTILYQYIITNTSKVQKYGRCDNII